MNGASREKSASEAADFFERARARLSLDVPVGLSDPTVSGPRGDHEVDPAVLAFIESRPSRQASVLIPVIDRGEPSVLLTRRSDALPNHAGQIAFPGGKIDPEDVSPMAAALREAEEEVGLSRDFVEPLGYLDLYRSTTGFRILPLVARVRPGFALVLNPGEVDETFEVPLAFLMHVDNHRQQTREWNGILRTVYTMPFGGRNIWGVTAGILRNLYDRIYRE